MEQLELLVQIISIRFADGKALQKVGQIRGWPFADKPEREAQ